MVEVVSLKCPVCGAPFEPGSERCNFCGSILLLRTDHPKINPQSLNKSIIDHHIVEFRNTLRQNANDVTAHYGLGVAYFNLRLVDDSIRELEYAAQQMPENPNIQAQLAVVLREAIREDLPGAENKLADRIKYALRLDPENIDALLLAAEQNTRLGDDKEAYVFYSRAYQVDPERSREGFARLIEAQALILSKSDPEADIKNPGRASEAIERWRYLFSVDQPLAAAGIRSFLNTNLDFLSRGERRELTAIRQPAKLKLNSPPKAQDKYQKTKQSQKHIESATSHVRAKTKGALKGFGLSILLFFAIGIMIALLPQAAPSGRYWSSSGSLPS